MYVCFCICTCQKKPFVVCFKKVWRLNKLLSFWLAQIRRYIIKSIDSLIRSIFSLIIYRTNDKRLQNVYSKLRSDKNHYKFYYCTTLLFNFTDTFLYFYLLFRSSSAPCFPRNVPWIFKVRTNIPFLVKNLSIKSNKVVDCIFSTIFGLP